MRFDEFLRNEDASSAQESEADDRMTSIIDPGTDFLPGSILVTNDKALSAARKVVDDAVHDVDPNLTVDWSGTIGTVRSGSEPRVIDRIEIHGATWSRARSEIGGVRFDMYGVRSYANDRNKSRK